MKLYIITFALLIAALTIHGQSSNTNNNRIALSEYEFNPKKVKLKINPRYATFKLEEVLVDNLDSIYVPIIRTTNQRLPLIPNNTSIANDIKNIIIKNYPNTDSSPIKLHIRDIRMLNNLLPTDNPKIYLSMDFYVKGKDDNFILAHTTTNKITLSYLIEKPLGKLFKSTIEDFCINKRYNNKLSEEIKNQLTHISTSGIFSSFKDLLENRINSDIRYTIIKEPRKFNSTIYHLKDHNTNKDVTNIVGFKHKGRSFINVGYYYSKNYYTELTSINNDYFLITDKIYDSNQANENTITYGGGLVGALSSSMIANKRAVALIEKKTGRMIVINNENIKTHFSASNKQADQYTSLIKENDLDSLIILFKEILNKQVK